MGEKIAGEGFLGEGLAYVVYPSTPSLKKERHCVPRRCQNALNVHSADAQFA